MRRPVFLIILAAVAISAACSGGSTGPGTPNPITPTPVTPPVPTASTVADPFLQKPFSGEWIVSNAMDHDYPVEFEDKNGRAITSWGEQAAFFDSHSGYDFMMPVGTPILAAAPGTVVTAEAATFFCPILNKNVTQLGVQIKHTFSNGLEYWTYYAHLSRVDVAAGQPIAAGAQLGLSGNTGCTTAPHLHFQLDRVNGTASGARATVDPYGWTGAGVDPWQANARGAISTYLWKSGQAPLMFLALDSITYPSNYAGSGPSKKPVVISTLRWMGSHDESNPNNEFVELKIDPAVYSAPAFDLTGSYIKNNAGDRFNFPSGTTLAQGQTLRLNVGSGTNSANNYYWGKAAGIFANSGDCAELFFPDGGYYLIGYATTCK